MVIKLTVSGFLFLDFEHLFVFLGQRSNDHMITGGHDMRSLLPHVRAAIATSTSQFLQRLSLQALKLLAIYQTRMLVSGNSGCKLLKAWCVIKYWK